MSCLVQWWRHTAGHADQKSGRAAKLRGNAGPAVKPLAQHWHGVLFASPVDPEGWLLALTDSPIPSANTSSSADWIFTHWNTELFRVLKESFSFNLGFVYVELSVDVLWFIAHNESKNGWMVL